MTNELSEENYKYMQENGIVCQLTRDPHLGNEVYILYKIDGIECKEILKVNVSDDIRIRNNPSDPLDYIIGLYKEGKMLTDDFIKQNPDWISTVESTVLNKLVTDLNGKLVSRLDCMFVTPDGKQYNKMLGKHVCKLDPLTIDPVLIAHSVFMQISPLLETNPLIYNGGIPRLPLIDYADNCCVMRIYATMRS